MNNPTLIEFPEQTVIIAKDQPEYLPFPAYQHGDNQGTITCCWKLNFWHRVKLLFTGKIWHSVLTFHQPLQPQLIEIDKPKFPKRDQSCGVLAKAALALAVLAMPMLVHAQSTNQIPNLLGNVPLTKLSQETVGVEVGTVMKGTSAFESSTAIIYDATKTFFIGGEMQNGTANNTVDVLGMRAGFYKSFETARIEGFFEGRRNWNTHSWEGECGIGAAWAPMASSNPGGVAANFSLFAENALIITRAANRPGNESKAGVRYSF